MFKKLMLSAVLAFTAVTGANAATVIWSAQPLVAVANPVAASFTGAFFANVTGSVPNVRRDLWQGTALAGTGIYSSIRGSVTFNFALRSTLEFIWGSPDAYNTLRFYNGLTLVDQFAPPPPHGLNVANSFATIQTVAQFNRVVFRSTRAAMEFGNVAAVPLPAGGLLLIGALGGIAALRRRKAA